MLLFLFLQNKHLNSEDSGYLKKTKQNKNETYTLESFTIHKIAVIPKYCPSHTTYFIIAKHMYIKQYYYLTFLFKETHILFRFIEENFVMVESFGKILKDIYLCTNKSYLAYTCGMFTCIGKQFKN